ncbi:MAG: pyridoxal-phosphate dependent enzyme [Nitrococcus mobilis]|nr:pyridoxal-phosphate dependent enzyme [Nitrococcus mobilis]
MSAAEPPDLATIEAAEKRIRDIVLETPSVCAFDLGEAIGQPLYLKAENLQRTGSFKARGAVNWIRTAGDEELAKGLVTVSAGNHAVALAWAARAEGVSVTVVMPEGSSPAKIATAHKLGAEVIVHGRIQEAVALCQQLRKDKGLTLVHPYDDPRVMAGQGTVALELLRQVPDLDRVLCPIGGGGLISGMGIAIKALKPEVAVLGVEPEGAATMRNAWDKGDHRAALEEIRTIAVSLAPVIVGEHTYATSRQVVDDIVTVGEAAIVEATKLLVTKGRLYVETGAAVALAALLEERVACLPERVTAAVITGGNMDVEQFCAL